jgi:hypothetical protein
MSYSRIFPSAESYETTTNVITVDTRAEIVRLSLFFQNNGDDRARFQIDPRSAELGNVHAPVRTNHQ